MNETKKITQEEYDQKIKEAIPEKEKSMEEMIEEAKVNMIEAAKQQTGATTNEELIQVIMATIPRLNSLRITHVPKGHTMESLKFTFTMPPYEFNIVGDISYHNKKNRAKKSYKMYREIAEYLDSLTIEEVIKRGEFDVIVHKEENS